MHFSDVRIKEWKQLADSKFKKDWYRWHSNSCVLASLSSLLFSEARGEITAPSTGVMNRVLLAGTDRSLPTWGHTAWRPFSDLEAGFPLFDFAASTEAAQLMVDDFCRMVASIGVAALHASCVRTSDSVDVDRLCMAYVRLKGEYEGIRDPQHCVVGYLRKNPVATFWETAYDPWEHSTSTRLLQEQVCGYRRDVKVRFVTLSATGDVFCINDQGFPYNQATARLLLDGQHAALAKGLK